MYIYIYYIRYHNVFSQMRNIDRSDTECGKEFEKYMFVCHLYATRCAISDVSSLAALVVKLLVALLRYTDIVPADKAYYEAGIAARVRTKRLTNILNLYNCRQGSKV